MYEKSRCGNYPVFQKRSGILARAVQSALLQQHAGEVSVIVVDDCSPVSSASELKQILRQHPERVTMLELPQNSGQSVARNAALDRLDPEQVEYVAFLDSDDQWGPDHLSNAMSALDKGFDFYFSDFYQLHQQTSAFNRAGRIDPSRHERLPGCHAPLHAYKGDMTGQIVTGNVIGTSTVVYRFRRFPALRFRAEFRSAGEDYLFWLELSRLTSRIAFSSAIECQYGEGVNIFSGATWGGDGSIRKLHDEMHYLQRIRSELILSADHVKHIRGEMKTVREAFVAEIIHRLRHGKKIDRQLSLSMIRRDIRSLLFFLPTSFKILMTSLMNKSE